MSSSTDGVYLPAKCGQTRKDFYMIYYKSYDNKWVLTYGKKEKPVSSGIGSSSVTVKLSPLRTGPQYRCPYCGERFTFTCWNCGKKTCYDGDNHDGREVICGHCGKSGVFRSGGKGGGVRDISGYGIEGQV